VSGCGGDRDHRRCREREKDRKDGGKGDYRSVALLEPGSWVVQDALLGMMRDPFEGRREDACEYDVKERGRGKADW
jgi:hypothetical protein